jgi:hypothetical protein
MDYTDDFIKKIRSFGALGYKLKKITNILELDPEDQDELKNEFEKPGSEVNIAYTKGRDQADYAIDMKLFQMAKEGDLKALESFERRKSMRFIDETLNKKNDNDE